MKNQQNNAFNTFGLVEKPKYIYTPVYLQILLLSINFYKVALDQVNLNYVVEKVLSLEEYFKCDSELSRIIVVFSHILNNQLVGEENIVRGILASLPEFVKRLCIIRLNGDSPENDFDMDDEAVEERAFGDD